MHDVTMLACVSEVITVGKTQIKDKYNEKVYARYTYRVRKSSDLYDCLEKFKERKGTSLNYLITKLLSDHFDVSMPNPTIDEW